MSVDGVRARPRWPTAAGVAPGGGRRIGRDGSLVLRFERRGAVTILAGCRFALPLQVLAPVALDDAACVVSLLNPTGGVVGGDRLVVDVAVGEQAHACLTTPSATRVHRAVAEPAEQRVRLGLAPGAILEWVPDHTIPSAGAALRQSMDVDVGEGATLFAIDAFAAGRIARDEAWRFALLESALTVRDRGGLLLHDRTMLTSGDAWRGLGLTEGRPYFATVVVVADTGVDDFITRLPPTCLADGRALAGAARLPRRGALVRCLASDAPALVATLARIWRLARATLLGAPPLDLRKG